MLGLDVKSSLPSNSQNKYLQSSTNTRYSLFPFCPNVSATAVIRCLCSLFSLFGAYIHSDSRTFIIAKHLRKFQFKLGVEVSWTTSYNFQGDGQCERCKGIIWKTVQLILKNRKLPIKHWEDVILEALCTIITLLCTSNYTNPQERFLKFSRRNSSGRSFTLWLSQPETVLLKKYMFEEVYLTLL